MGGEKVGRSNDRQLICQLLRERGRQGGAVVEAVWSLE